METLAVLAALFLICVLLRARRIKPAAARIVSNLKKPFTADHEFRVIDAAALVREFGHLDLDYYLGVTRELEEKGFTHLADVQDVTTSALYPPGWFYRVMLNSDGTIRASFYHLTCAGRSGKVAQMVTEFSDAVLFFTRNRSPGDAMTMPATTQIEYLGQNASPADLFARHEERVRRYLSEHPGVHPLPIGSIEESIESVKREIAKQARHRESVGWITQAELGEIVKGRSIQAFLLRKAIIRELAKETKCERNTS